MRPGESARASEEASENAAGKVTGSIEYRETRDFPLGDLVELYRANGWSAADKPHALLEALTRAHTVVSAWDGERLVGLASAISDGCLVVYYPHVLVHPRYQRRGIGTQLLASLARKYRGLHQQVLVAAREAVPFYKRCGFEPAPDTVAMWILEHP